MNAARILIIDDEPHWIDFAKEDLNQPLFEIVVAKNIAEAMQWLDENRFVLVIASSGYLEELQKISDRYKMIITTVHPSTQEARAAYKMGAERYLAKSFGSRDLLESVQEVLPLADR